MGNNGGGARRRVPFVSMDLTIKHITDNEVIVTGTIYAISYIGDNCKVYILLWNGKNNEDMVLVKCYCSEYFECEVAQQVTLQGTIQYYKDNNHSLVDAKPI